MSVPRGCFGVSASRDEVIRTSWQLLTQDSKPGMEQLAGDLWNRLEGSGGGEGAGRGGRRGLNQHSDPGRPSGKVGGPELQPVPIFPLPAGTLELKFSSLLTHFSC